MSIVYYISQRNKTSLCLLFDHQLTLPYVIGAGQDKFFSQGHFLIEPDVKKFNPDFSLDFFLRLRLFPMHNIIAYSHAKKVILTKCSTSLLNDSIIKSVF